MYGRSKSSERKIRVEMHYLNIPYRSTEAEIPATRLLSVWKVEANEGYQFVQSAGFGTPGMFLTFAGRGTFSFLHSDDVISIRESSFFIVNANNPCRYRCPPGSFWNFFFIQFSDLDVVRYLNLPVAQVVETENMRVLRALCDRIIQNLIVETRQNVYDTLHAFHLILTRLSLERAHHQSSVNAQITSTLHWMHSNIDKPLDLDKLAHESHISRTRFFQCFKQITGATPSQYFYQLKLESARIALESTNESVKTIAESLGFSDEFHLMKRFKAAYGMSPATYRRTPFFQEK